METSINCENNEATAISSEFPVDISDWNKEDVKRRMLEINMDKNDVDILYNLNVNGKIFLQLKEVLQNLSKEAKDLITQHKDLQNQKTQQLYEVMPYPFSRFHAAHRYIEGRTLVVTETGPIDLIQPCHEFKEFTRNEDDIINQFTYEVIRFAAACMNSCTNGTIHFGVKNHPHGQILGVSVQKTDNFNDQLSHAIERHFLRNVEIAKKCIKPPRFVEVLKADMTSAGKYVIEVDIEPSSKVCQHYHFNTYNVEKKKKKKKKKKKEEEKEEEKEGDKSFFIRDSSSSRNLITAISSKEYEEYTAIANMQRLSQLRKDAEEKHLSVVKNSVQGSKLCEMITGGTQSMDRSHFEWYILVANKFHDVQLENLDFLLHMKNLVAVLDFDPQSAENGLNKILEERKMFIDHLPAQYKVTGPVEDIANGLKLTKNTSWVFCNGGINVENPSDADHWLTEKGSSVRDVVSFLCKKDVLPQKKFLTIFLLLSQVSDANDPLLETFGMFLQELNGGNQILCISDNKTTYNNWKDLIKCRFKFDISTRCIYELSFAEVNGTVLSLWSENRKSSRFLPGVGGSNVVLSKKTEESLDTLSVLCMNQCDGGDEDKQHHEENFYKGGKVSWWNFYFSEQPGSMPFIKRDKFDYIVNTIIPDIHSQKRTCEFFNIFHLPGCGGTTLAMHVLWTLKDKFRCAVLKDTTDDYSTVAKQVVLLTYETNKKTSRLPVLLMIDDFQDICDVKKLQDQIVKECQEQNNSSNSPQVIIVNCMRVEYREQTEGIDNAVFIGNNLSEKEQKLFKEKLKEFEKTSTNTETFYGFMILKNNFSSDYIQGVVKNTLKGFNFEHKHAQLFAVLVLLHVYSRNASLSVFACEKFLELQTKADSESCKVKDGFEKFSTLLTRCTVVSKVTFKGVRVIHSSIAQHCLEELSASHGVSKAEITNLLLTTKVFYEYTLGKQKLKQDVHNMLVKRQYSSKAEDSLFSPLIQHIMKETPGREEIVLHNAAKRYSKDAIIFQLLARYYIKKQDFTMAKNYAKEAKGLSKENSYICDTVSQVLVRELKHAVHKDRDGPIKPESLDRYLTLAESAAEACKETQQSANKEAENRLQRLKDYNTYNTAGHLSELQTAATVIQILSNTPFNSDFASSNCLTQFFLGKITIEDLSREKPKLKHYCDVLQKHMIFLLQLKERMKKNFVFFDNLFVNLVFPEKDKQNERTMSMVSKYFRQYAVTYLFWEVKIKWSELINNKRMDTTAKIEQTRECLERNKGYSYIGLLGYLYEKDSASTLEEIIQQYDFILKSQEKKDMDTVNFIYANVILANINPESKHYIPYQELHKLLNLTKSFHECLQLHYITVLLLWQEKENIEIPNIVTKMKASYSADLKPLSNGKRDAVHFFLGKGKGYVGLISLRDINGWLGSGQDISTQWSDEGIWKKIRESKKLRRVSGKIRDNLIWVADVKFMIDPMFRSQLHKESGTKVKFFIGFSMNGPVAVDILWVRRFTIQI